MRVNLDKMKGGLKPAVLDIFDDYPLYGYLLGYTKRKVIVVLPDGDIVHIPKCWIISITIEGPEEHIEDVSWGTCSICGSEDLLRDGLCYRHWSEEVK